MMASVLELMAGQFVDNYPIEIIEKISKKCIERIKRECRREVVIKLSIKFNMTKEELLDYCHFLHNMNILQMVYTMNQWFRFISNVKKLINNKEANILGLIDMLENTSNTSEILKIVYIDEYIFNQDQSKQITELLYQYPEYRKYFTIVECGKGDYVAIFLNSEHEYNGYEINCNVGKINLTSNDNRTDNYLYSLYQVD